MQVTSILRRAAQINPNGLATIHLDRQQDWTTLLDRVARLAGALQKLGVGPDDRVGRDPTIGIARLRGHHSRRAVSGPSSCCPRNGATQQLKQNLMLLARLP